MRIAATGTPALASQSQNPSSAACEITARIAIDSTSSTAAWAWPARKKLICSRFAGDVPAHDLREEVAAALDGDEGEQQDADEDDVVRGRHGRTFRGSGV